MYDALGDLSLDLLRAFKVAARQRSSTAAAVELSSTQPAMSQQIKRLEDQLGTRLFDRIYRGIELTGAGAILFQQVKAGLQNIVEVALHPTRLQSRAARLAKRCSLDSSAGLQSKSPRRHRPTLSYDWRGGWRAHKHSAASPHRTPQQLAPARLQCRRVSPWARWRARWCRCESSQQVSQKSGACRCIFCRPTHHDYAS